MSAAAVLLPAAEAAGLELHHAKGGKVVCVGWLDDSQPSPIPPFGGTQIGVAGIAIDDDGHVLVVKDRHKSDTWKFPGGGVDPGEDLDEATLREVREETGVVAEYGSLVLVRQMHGMAWGVSDLYCMSRLVVRGTQPEIQLDPVEILDATWMPLPAFIAQCEHAAARHAAMSVQSWLASGRTVDADGWSASKKDRLLQWSHHQKVFSRRPIDT